MAGPDASAIEETPGGVLIRVYVQPRSSTNRVVGVHNGALKIALTAPPVEGAANKALVEFLAKTLGVPKTNVTIASGESSRHKIVSAKGTSSLDARARLLPSGQ